MGQKQQLITWLRDAHAAGRCYERVLKRHAREAEHHPEFRLRIAQHAEATHRHVEMLEGCIKGLGGEPGSSNTWVGFPVLRRLGTDNANGDSVVRNALAEYASEQFEIASHISILAAAVELYETDVAASIRRILNDDLDMAEWLEEQIPELTREQLAKAHSGSSQRRRMMAAG